MITPFINLELGPYKTWIEWTMAMQQTCYVKCVKCTSRHLMIMKTQFHVHQHNKRLWEFKNYIVQMFR